MDNSLNNAYDYSSLLKDIQERQDIINKYNTYGYLDRNDAINKIKELRITDKKVMTATAAELAVRSVPFNQASNETIIAELQMQIDILKAEFAEKTGEII